jgi:diacylglycerol kinase (ATP)
VKTLVIINPASRAALVPDTKRKVADQLAEHNPDIEVTCYSGHATILTREAARNRYDTVVAVGGDGTVNEVLNGIVGSDTALGVIPAGTANDLAHHHGIPDDITKACQVILGRRMHCPDAISVNGWCYLTVGGIGLPCQTLITAEAIKSGNGLRRWLGQMVASRLYLLALMSAFARRGWKGSRVQMRCAEDEYAEAIISLIIGNQPCLGNHFQVLPGALNDDGMFDVFAIHDLDHPFTSFETVIRTINRTHVGRRDVRFLRTNSLDIETDCPVPFFGDGQIGKIDSRFSIRLIPQAVRLIVPQGWRDN